MPVSEDNTIPERNYMCQEPECERQFDYIVSEAREGESMWLCMPHFLAFAATMIETAVEQSREE